MRWRCAPRVDLLHRRIEIAEAATEFNGTLVWCRPKTPQVGSLTVAAFVTEELLRHSDCRCRTGTRRAEMGPGDRGSHGEGVKRLQMPCRQVIFACCARSSTGQSSGLLIRRLRVRVAPGAREFRQFWPLFWPLSLLVGDREGRGDAIGPHWARKRAGGAGSIGRSSKAPRVGDQVISYCSLTTRSIGWRSMLTARKSRKSNVKTACPRPWARTITMQSARPSWRSR